MIREHLTRLGKELGFEPKDFDTDEVGLYKFPINRDIKIELREDEYGLYMTSSISGAPTRNREQLFIDFMNANVFGQATYGNVLGLTDDSKFVTLSRQIDTTPPYEEFHDLFEDYINACIFWRKKASEYV